MVAALTWALSMITGIPLRGASRPRRSLCWLTCGYGVVGAVICLVCGFLGWIFSFSALLSALLCGVGYWFLTWKLLPMSRGGEYLLSGCWVRGGGVAAGYESSRRQALYLGLLCYRAFGVLVLSHAFGSAWFLPVLLLGGCTVSEGVRQHLSVADGVAWRRGGWLHWYVSWGCSVSFCGLVALVRGCGVILLLGILACVFSLSLAFLCPRLVMGQTELPALRRVWWTVSELCLLTLGLLGLLL